MFGTPRALALSYVDPYVDYTGRVTGYAVVDLRAMGTYDWRLASTNVWKVERVLLEYPHRAIRSSDARIDRLRNRGGDPFGEYQVPVAVLMLKQGLGRLIRSASDRGVLAVLDMEPCPDDQDVCPTYSPDRPYDAALEANAGWFDGAGVSSGDLLEIDRQAGLADPEDEHFPDEGCRRVGGGQRGAGQRVNRPQPKALSSRERERERERVAQA